MSYLLNISKEKLAELKIQAAKEGTSIKAIIESQIDEYLKVHKDGNPQFTIDQFDDPNFVACPAFYRSGDMWDKYLSTQEPKELEKVKSQILLIEKKMMQYL